MQWEPELFNCQQSMQTHCFFPMVPLNCTAQISNSQWLLGHAPVQKCVCAKVAEVGGQEGGGSLHKEGQCPGTARKDLSEESCCPLKTLHHNHPLLCPAMLGITSIQMFPSQTYVYRDVAAALKISFPQRHAARIAQGTRR